MRDAARAQAVVGVCMWKVYWCKVCMYVRARTAALMVQVKAMIGRYSKMGDARCQKSDISWLIEAGCRMQDAGCAVSSKVLASCICSASEARLQRALFCTSTVYR